MTYTIFHITIDHETWLISYPIQHPYIELWRTNNEICLDLIIHILPTNPWEMYYPTEGGTSNELASDYSTRHFKITSIDYDIDIIKNEQIRTINLEVIPY